MAEKKLLPRKEHTVEEIENLVHELQTIADKLEGHRYKSDINSMVVEICHEEDICLYCFTKIDEVWYNEGLIRQCNCKSKRIAV